MSSSTWSASSSTPGWREPASGTRAPIPDRWPLITHPRGQKDNSDVTITTPGKGRRIVAAERQTIAKDPAIRYAAGENLRSLATSTGRSYGFVHPVLTESDTQLRQHGGAHQHKPQHTGSRT